MEFRVLGPVEVRDGDRLVAVPTVKARTLLVALLLLQTYLQRQQHLPEWSAAAEAGLRAAEAAGDRLAEAAMHRSLGILRERGRGPAAAIEHHQAALDRYRQADCGSGQAAALCDLGRNYFVTGDVPSATAVLEQGIALIRRLGIAELLGTALNCQSVVHLLRGELPQAWRYNVAALRTERPPRILLMINRGAIHRLLGEYEPAVADVTAGLTLSRKRKERHLEALCHDELARIWLDAGQLELACEHAERTLRLARQTDDAWCEPGALVTLGDLRGLQARLDQADAHCTRALHVAVARGLRIHEAEARLGLASTRRCAGQPDVAHEYGRLAMDIARRAELRILESQILDVLAAISRDLGEPTDAARYAEQARRIQDETGYHCAPRDGSIGRAQPMRGAGWTSTAAAPAGISVPWSMTDNHLPCL